MKLFSQETIRDIISKFNVPRENEMPFYCSIDEDRNYYLSFEQYRNTLTIILDAFNDGLKLREIKRVTEALTGDWKKDVMFGISKVLDVEVKTVNYRYICSTKTLVCESGLVPVNKIIVKHMNFID